MKTGLLFSTTLLLLPVATFAASYQYIDTGGTVRTVSAESSSEAVQLATNIDPHSGIMPASGSLSSGDNVVVTPTPTASDGTQLYHYIDRNGVVQDVRARSAAEAMSLAVNMDSHSGVKLDMGVLRQGDTVSL